MISTKSNLHRNDRCQIEWKKILKNRIKSCGKRWDEERGELIERCLSATAVIMSPQSLNYVWK